jgi:hypothetical protein
MAQTQDIQSDGTNEVDADPVTLEPLNSDPVQSRYHANTVDTKYQIFSATADWNLGPASLVSVTSYGTFEQDSRRRRVRRGSPVTRPALASIVTYLSRQRRDATAELRPAADDEHRQAHAGAATVSHTNETSTG